MARAEASNDDEDVSWRLERVRKTLQHERAGWREPPAKRLGELEERISALQVAVLEGTAPPEALPFVQRAVTSCNEARRLLEQSSESDGSSDDEAARVLTPEARPGANEQDPWGGAGLGEALQSAPARRPSFGPGVASDEPRRPARPSGRRSDPASSSSSSSFGGGLGEILPSRQRQSREGGVVAQQGQEEAKARPRSYRSVLARAARIRCREKNKPSEGNDCPICLEAFVWGQFVRKSPCKVGAARMRSDFSPIFPFFFFFFELTASCCPCLFPCLLPCSTFSMSGAWRLGCELGITAAPCAEKAFGKRLERESSFLRCAFKPTLKKGIIESLLHYASLPAITNKEGVNKRKEGRVCIAP